MKSRTLTIAFSPHFAVYLSAVVLLPLLAYGLRGPAPELSKFMLLPTYILHYFTRAGGMTETLIYAVIYYSVALVPILVFRSSPTAAFPLVMMFLVLHTLVYAFAG